MKEKLVVSLFLVVLLCSASYVRADDLYFSFNLAPVGSWESVTAPLSAGNWHVGSASGPLATGAQIDSTLHSLAALEIGATGNAVAQGNLNQSFGFRLSNPNLAGLESDDFMNGGTWPNDWICSGDSMSSCPNVVGGSGGGFPSGGFIGDYSFDDSSSQLLFVAPARYLGDQGTASGGNLSFAFEAPNGTGSTPGYDLTSGVVILRGASAVPEPSSVMLLGIGVIGCAGLIRGKLLR